MSFSKKGDYILSIASFTPLVVLMLQQLTLELDVLPHEKSRLIGIIISGVIMFPALFIIANRNLRLLVITYLITIIAVLYTLIFFPENTQYLISGSFYLLLINIPIFLCVSSIKNSSHLIDIMLLASKSIFIIGLLVLSLKFLGIITHNRYSMSFSYYLLLPALFFLNQRKYIYNLGFIIICIMMLLFGSRGAFLISISYLFISTSFFTNSKLSVKLLFIVFIISFFYIDLFEVAIFIEDTFNISSRTLSMMLSGNITSDSGRFDLYTKLWTDILENPIFGKGIFGDRVLLSFLDGEVYSHNIFLEILHNFGFVVGGAFILIMLKHTLVVYFKLKSEYKGVFSVLVFSNLTPLFFSGSYLTSFWFGLYLGTIYLFNQKKYFSI